MTDLTFPVLEASEILLCMQELSIPCQAEDLKKPTHHRILQIYEQFAELLLGHQSQNSTPDFNSLLETPDLQHDSIALMTFYRQLLKIVTIAGIHNFSLRDILTPTAKRVRIIFSAIINFCKFREAKIQLYDQFSEQSEAIVQELKSSQSKFQDITEKVNSIKLSLAEEQPRVEQVKQTVTEITKDLRALKQQQNTINNEIEELKKSKSSISEKIMNNSFLITNLKQDCAKLSSRIVTNPEILKNTILDMNQSVQNDKNLLHQSERKNRDLTARIESMVLVDQDIEGCCTLLEQVDQERKRKRENKERLNKENEEFLTKTNQLRELTIKEQQLSRQLKSTNEKMNRLIEHQTQRENMNEAKFNQIKKDYQEILESYNSTLQKSKDMDSTYLDIETKMSVEKKEFEAEMDGLRVNYEKLGVELKKYTNELTSKMSLLQ